MFCSRSGAWMCIRPGQDWSDNEVGSGVLRGNLQQVLASRQAYSGSYPRA